MCIKSKSLIYCGLKQTRKSWVVISTAYSCSSRNIGNSSSKVAIVVANSDGSGAGSGSGGFHI